MSRGKTVRELQAAYEARMPVSELWEELHALAEAGHSAAMPLFESMLDDPEWPWRQLGIQLLGFHFRFKDNDPFLARLRDVLASDPEPQVRISAAFALGGQTRWQEKCLVDALEKDGDEDVRLSAFSALLRQGGVSPKSILKYEKDVERGELGLTIETVKDIVRTETS
jgi:HEAT repeat protein